VTEITFLKTQAPIVPQLNSADVAVMNEELPVPPNSFRSTRQNIIKGINRLRHFMEYLSLPQP